MTERGKKNSKRGRGKTASLTKSALQKSNALHEQADAVHKQASSMHRASTALRKKVHAATKRTINRPSAPRTEQLPPRASAKDRVEPRRKVGAPEAGAVDAGSQPRSVLPFTVVGIGASAGGFEATTALLSNLPSDLGCALVVLQHLDPTHESKLAELLSHNSPLQIVQIKSGMEVERNRMYVLPPNATVVLNEGRFRLGPREPNRNPMPIDFFFRSLASEQQNRAIGIVLSGTGTDGTLGLAEIKGQGGLTFAQDKGSAKHYGMPGSAIAAGVVDFIMSPEAMAAELKRLAGHPYINAQRSREQKAALVQETPPAETLFKNHADEMKSLFALLRSRAAVDFSLYKPGTLNRRILRRMTLHKIDELPGYLKLLQQNTAEVDALFNDLLISVTGFFRDTGTYQALKKRILPRLMKHRRNDSPLRVWCCGCATGEEAYSLAIVLTEYLEQTRKHVPVQIFASDLNERGIEKARSGIYHENILIDVSRERLRRFFVKVDGFYQVNKHIRDMCVFARQNVVVDPPFSNLDIISCRNVLIYLSPVLQRRIMPVFHYALKPGGYMLLGSSETIGEASELFELVDRKNKVYAKKATAYRPVVDFEKRFVPPREISATLKPPVPERREHVESSLQQKVDRLILNQFSPAGVVINRQMDVLQFRGKTAPFLEHQPGAASLNLLRMAHEELVLDIRRAVNKALQTNERVEQHSEMRLGDRTHHVSIQVHPLPSGSDREKFFLVTFREMPHRESEKAIVRNGGKRKAAQDRSDARKIPKLREELDATKDSLQSIIEEQEATNEELKSANEEIQSSNEELQSTNEELETAREELQSTNEELTTLNEELQNRNTELAQANNDLTNLLASINIAIIMLGTDSKIRRFTPTAEKVFNLIPSDVGRKLSDLNRNIQVPDLDEAIIDVVENLTVVDREVQDRDGRWYALRIRPYRTRESRIDGAVLVLLDIDEIKRAIKHIISLAREPLLTLGADLKVVHANDAFCRTFGVNPDQLDNKSVYEIADGQWNIPRLKQLLEEYLPSQGELRDFRLEHDFPKLGKRQLMINARRFYEEGRGLQSILLAIEDVT
jgi:two-component system, chemotaxis family, CheB/CheR fusion protein